MEKKGNLTLYHIFVFITSMVFLNLLFLIPNLPIVIISIMAGIKNVFHYPIFILLFLITLPPAAIALFRTSFDWVINKNLSFKSFFKIFKSSFSIDSLPLYFLTLMPCSLFFQRIIIRSFPMFKIIAPVYYLIAFICGCMFPFACLEIALFKVSPVKQMKNILIETAIHPGLSIITILYCVFSLLLVGSFPASILIFIFSLYAYVFTSFYSSNLQERIEVARVMNSDHKKEPIN